VPFLVRITGRDWRELPIMSGGKTRVVSRRAVENLSKKGRLLFSAGHARQLPEQSARRGKLYLFSISPRGASDKDRTVRSTALNNLINMANLKQQRLPSPCERWPQPCSGHQGMLLARGTAASGYQQRSVVVRNIHCIKALTII
jgi:hypothetical protein